MALRKTLYRTVEESQEDLDFFLEDYNNELIGQARYRQGRTPPETSTHGLQTWNQYVFDGVEEMAAE